MRITSAVPAAIDERKNEIGSSGDHHCGASLSGISRNNDPNELWCMVESVTAAIASMTGSVCPRFGWNTHASVAKIAAATAVYTRLRESRKTNSEAATATYAPDQRRQNSRARGMFQRSKTTG